MSTRLTVELIFWGLIGLAALVVFVEAGLVASWRAAAQRLEQVEPVADTVSLVRDYQPRHLLPGEDTVVLQATRYVPARTALVRRYTRTGA